MPGDQAAAAIATAVSTTDGAATISVARLRVTRHDGAGDESRGAHVAMRWSFHAENAQEACGARQAFRAYLSERSGEEAALLAAEIIFGELVANVIQHAPGPIEIVVEWSGAEPTLRVRDRGPGFERAVRRTRDPLGECGHGLVLVETLTRGLTIERRPGGGADVSVVLPVQRDSNQPMAMRARRHT